MDLQYYWYYLYNTGYLWSMGLLTIAIIIHSTKLAGRRRSNSSSSSSSLRLPPGSMGLPFIGETIQFLIPSNSLDTPSFVKNRIQKYGEVFKTSLLGRAVVISADSNFNHYILQQEGKLVELGYMDSFDKIVGIKEIKEIGLLSMGSIHKYMRGVVYTHFGNEKIKEILISRWELIVNQMLQTWSVRNSLELKRSLTEGVFNFTANILFGYDHENSTENFGEIVCDIMEGMMSIPLKIPGTTFHRCFKAREKALKLISDTMKERIENPERRRGDVLDQLIDDMEKQAFLKESNIPTLLTGILIASFETIAVTLTLAISFIAENSHVLDQLLKEHEEIINVRKGSENGLITWNEYKCMTFTTQVVNETLRMASVAPGILRKVIQDIQINDYIIPRGWSILVVLSAVQLNPKTFVDPLTFNPWRWKDLGAEVTMKNFIPFGGGMRPCSGSEFSKMVMAIFIHVMVTKYRFTKIKGGEIVRKPLLGFGKGYFVKVETRERRKMN